MRLKRAEEGTTLWLLKMLLEQASDFENCDDLALLKKRLRKIRSLAEGLALVYPDLRCEAAFSHRPEHVTATQDAKYILTQLYLTGAIKIEQDED